MLALCPLSSNAATGVERSSRGCSCDATATAAATTADARSATQQHWELTNNGGDSSIGIRDSGQHPGAAVSGSEPGPQDRTTCTTPGTKTRNRLQKAYQAVTRKRRVQLQEDDFVYQEIWRLRLFIYQ